MNQKNLEFRLNQLKILKNTIIKNQTKITNALYKDLKKMNLNHTQQK